LASVTEIANMALTLVGASTIVDIDEQSNSARTCKTVWPFVRRSVLRMHDWNAATARAALAPSVTAPLWEYPTAYPLPADCLHVMEVDTSYDWRVEGKELLTHGSGSVNIRYMRDETDVSKYDSTLTMTFAYKMAVEICERITGNARKREQLYSLFREVLNSAMLDDGEEQSTTAFEEDSWITSRYVY